MNFKIIIFVIAALICQITSFEVNSEGRSLRQARDTKSVKKPSDSDNRGWWWWGSPFLIKEESRHKRDLDLPIIKIPKIGAHFRSARNVKTENKYDKPEKFKKYGNSRRSGSDKTPSKRGWCWWCWWWW